MRKAELTEDQRLEMIVEAVLYCQRVQAMGMPSVCWSKSLREPVFFLWEKYGTTKMGAARFRSDAAIGLSPGKGLVRYDHAIPFRYVQEALLALDPPTPESVRAVLESMCVACLITKAEDDRLTAEGLNHAMPEGWNGLDPLARYAALNISVVPNPTYTGGH